MIPDGTPLAIVLDLVYAMLAVGLFLSFYRMVRGPSVPDRVVALELMGTLAAGLIVLTAISTGQSMMLRLALVLSLVAFLGTVILALYIARRGMP